MTSLIPCIMKSSVQLDRAGRREILLPRKLKGCVATREARLREQFRRFRELFCFSMCAQCEVYCSFIQWLIHTCTARQEITLLAVRATPYLIRRMLFTPALRFAKVRDTNVMYRDCDKSNSCVELTVSAVCSTELRFKRKIPFPLR